MEIGLKHFFRFRLMHLDGFPKIENICKNAVDAMEGKGEIEVALIDVPEGLFVDISDTGKGIPASTSSLD